MGEYELIVFMSDNIIRVLEVDYEGGSKVVGFHGEDQFAFKDAEGIDDFFNIGRSTVFYATTVIVYIIIPAFLSHIHGFQK